MSFKENMINKDQRLHLNLSLYAWDIIENDINSFYYEHSKSDKNISNFINRILINYSENSPFNLKKLYKTEHDKFEILFKDSTLFKLENEQLNSFLEKISIESTLKIAGESIITDKGRSCKIRLNNSVYNHLISFSSESLEYILFRKPGKYVKSIIESYCRLPYVIREKYFFSDIIEIINTAVQLSCALKIKLSNGDIYEIFPYSIITNNSSDYNYVVGVSTNEAEFTDFRTVSFRISRIIKYKTDLNKTIKWSSGNIKKIKDDISQKGVQFLLNDAIDIKIKLTDEGINKYYTQLNLRPPTYKIEDNNVYYFHTTPMQAKFYFFKFGKDAEIIYPLKLREWFYSEYSKAKETYEKN